MRNVIDNHCLFKKLLYIDYYNQIYYSYLAKSLSLMYTSYHISYDILVLKFKMKTHSSFKIYISSILLHLINKSLNIYS